MKDGWDRYATEKRYKQKGYLRKYSNGGEIGEARETSCRDSLLCSKEKKEIDYPNELYGKTVLLREEVVYIGKADDQGKEETFNKRRKSNIGRRNSSAQPESSESGELAMSTISGKLSRKGRKTRVD